MAPFPGTDRDAQDTIPAQNLQCGARGVAGLLAPMYDAAAEESVFRRNPESVQIPDTEPGFGNAMLRPADVRHLVARLTQRHFRKQAGKREMRNPQNRAAANCQSLVQMLPADDPKARAPFRSQESVNGMDRM